MKVVLTRPVADSEALARALATHDIDSIVAPMLSIAMRDTAELDADLDQAQAILLTSANGARALAGATEGRDLPVYAVGDATAAIARDAGFAKVASADGDAADLAKLASSRLSPDAGLLLHLSGAHVAGDLEEALTSVGFAYRRAILYDAVAAETFPDSLLAALRERSADAVLFFSPRSARTFVELARKNDLTPTLKSASAYCLSDAVAEAADRDSWRRVVVSAHPRSESLINQLVADRDADRPQSAPARPSQPSRMPAVETEKKVWPWLPTAVSAVVAGIVALVVAYAFRGTSDPIDTTEETAELTARLQSLETQNRDLASQLAAIQSQGQDRADLSVRLDALEAQLLDLARKSDNVVDPAEIATLRNELATVRTMLSGEIDRALQPMATRVSALEETVDGVAGRLEQLVAQDLGATGALLLAVGQLRAAALGSGPFANEIDAVRAVSGNASEIAVPLRKMSAWADSGVDTLDMLQASFQDTAVAILRAEALPADAGWFETAYAEVKGLVTVRPVGEDVEGDDAEAVLARAEALLLRGDVAGAVKLIETIDGASAAASDWLDNARGRSIVGAALDDVSRIAFKLAAAANPNP